MSINIVNILPGNKKSELMILEKIYNEIGTENYGALNIEQGKFNKIEIDMVI